MKKMTRFAAIFVAMMMAFTVTVGLAACSDGNDDGTEQGIESITIFAQGTTAALGDTVEISVSFTQLESVLETLPTKVDVYVEGVEDAIAKDLAVSDGKISFGTGEYNTGSYNIYVKTGDYISNKLPVVLTSDVPAPTNVTIAEGATNQVRITCDGTASYYWFYYSKTNNPLTATYIDWQTSKSQTRMLSESGTYYFWVKASESYGSTETERSKRKTSAFSEVASYTFTYSQLETPTNVTVTLNKTNQVKIACEGNSQYYWFYYSKTNDTSTATYIDWQTSKSQTLMLSESGTYYFWVKAADGYGATETAREKIAQSDFSAVAEYAFTYITPSVPTNVSVTLNKTNQVKITCDGDAGYYWFYYSKTNDASTATYIDWQTSKSQTLMLSESGTYYFWVKAADGYGATETARAAIAQSDFSSVAEYAFTYTTLSTPTGITVTQGTSASRVTIKCTDNNSAYYWFYYGTENDTSKAIYVDWQVLASHTMTLSAAGTYYFWVKAADGYGSTETVRATVAQSDFSSVETYTYSN